jgi:hypothetical protein
MVLRGNSIFPVVRHSEECLASLSKMIDNMLKFGMAKNFSGQTGERALKLIVKDHAQQTQRRADKFTEQCAMREYEDNVIAYVYQDIASQQLE